MMTLSRPQAALIALSLLGTAYLAKTLAPHQLMARSVTIDLDKAIPKQFGEWKLVPTVEPVAPTETEGVPDPNSKDAPVYSQEVGRGYVNNNGDLVMLMVAYGPVQNYRLKAHRPEICYTAAGFRVSGKHEGEVLYARAQKPLKLTRLVAQRESRFEPISYWMRVGNDVTTGIIDRQLVRLKYGLEGLIPDGALFRISTVGLSKETSYAVQDKFIHDLLQAIAPQDRKFFIGT